ncbi:MAG: hypothetical protein KGJ90_06255 [Patescibacteria group bacterium]|nr:hypothetical protein [Patescibacteria group bacterium]
MSRQNDIEDAKFQATMSEWRKGVDKVLDDYHLRIGEVEKCQLAMKNAARLLIPFMTLGGLLVFILCLSVFALQDPSTAAATLKLLTKSLFLASPSSR